MTWGRGLLAVVAILVLASGQILFKLAASHVDFRIARLLPSLCSPLIIFTLVIYGFATILWLAVLKTTPLSIAYSFTALGFFLVPILARIFLREELHVSTFVGALFIVTGVFITVKN